MGKVANADPLVHAPDGELSPKQVAARLGITRRTLRYWVSIGRFPKGTRYSYRTVRWRPEVVDAFKGVALSA